MTLANLKTILSGITGFSKKVVYRAFPVGDAPALPFICYIETDTDNFFADNRVYRVIQDVDIELYSKKKDTASETLIETTLATNNITWNKSEQYLSDEDMYEVIYSITIDY